MRLLQMIKCEWRREKEVVRATTEERERDLFPPPADIRPETNARVEEDMKTFSRNSRQPYQSEKAQINLKETKEEEPSKEEDLDHLQEQEAGEDRTFWRSPQLYQLWGKTNEEEESNEKEEESDLDHFQ